MLDQTRRNDAVEAYLRALIARVVPEAGANFDAQTPFGELGINSFYVLKIIKALEVDFGPLPKTLLFENFQVRDLAEYFSRKHGPAVARICGQDADAAQGAAGVGEVTTAPSVLSVRAAVTDVPEGSPSPSLGLAPATAIRGVEADFWRHPELGPVVRALYDAYKCESSVSRGTRNIAPNLFLGARQLGYVNYGRCGAILLAYGYTGPADYFPELVRELVQHCQRHQLQLNLFYDEDVGELGGIAFTSTPFGVMQRIESLPQFSLEGSKMRRLRYQVSKFASAGAVRTTEFLCGSDAATTSAILALIDQWCAARDVVNPLVFRVREEVQTGTLSREHRIFLTYLDEVLQNVILISPMSGEVTGYLMDLEFYPKQMPLGGLEYAIVEIIRQLLGEGCEIFSLGGTYGCKLERANHADPEVDVILDDLRAQNIFNDQGNLQFKNKFRPHNRTIYLCRPTGMCEPHNVLDVIMMIADPDKMQTCDGEHHNLPAVAEPLGAPISLAPAALSTDNGAADRLKVLAECKFNVHRLPPHCLSLDLQSDSWARLAPEVIAEPMALLRAGLQQRQVLPPDLSDLLPFSHHVLTASGRMAEHVFFKSWPRKGAVLQNLLFPTTIYHQIEQGFTPVELPHPQIVDVVGGDFERGWIDEQAVRTWLERDADAVALVCVELANNAAGGAAQELAALRRLRELLQGYGIALVVDGTRALAHAQQLCARAGRSDALWSVARELFGCADVVLASLVKEYAVEKGGVVATNDATLAAELRALAQREGCGLSPIDKKLLSQALRNRARLAEFTRRRVAAVHAMWQTLQSAGVPVVAPAGGHCVVIDVGRMPAFRDLSEPVASFLAWLYIKTGIRGGAHNVGMECRPSLAHLVRLALPIATSDEAAAEAASAVAHAFISGFGDVPDLVAVSTGGSAATLDGEYRLREHRPQNSPDAAAAVSCADADSGCLAGANTARNGDVPAAAGIDIAIVGMAGRYPDAADLGELWRNLRSGRDSIRDLPSSRTRLGRISGNRPGGYLEDIDRFDSLFFNISPREAATMDPQERLFLEVAWEALEDAGYDPDHLVPADHPRDIGVFVGAVWTLYQALGAEARSGGADVAANSFLWSIPNRVSYCMNLTGPSMAVDTACSASLTALHLACEALHRGQCSGAIVGGVNLDVHQAKQEITVAGGLLADDHRCRAFGKGGSGYVAGEGVGAIYIKPLASAVAAGDHIYGVIKGIGINHGGRTSGYAVPNPGAQTAAICNALAQAQVDPRSVGYIEAHGTGTELGDPIEIAGLAEAFANHGVEPQQCAIGSVKSNVGHLEAAAGIIGLSKILLQMQFGELVPSLHSAELNEFIDFANTPFMVQQEVAPWRGKSIAGVPQPLRAGLSSFGAGGSNVHVIVEAYASASAAPCDERGWIFPLSARSEKQLAQVADRLHRHLLAAPRPYGEGDLADLAFTLQVGRKSFEYRAAIVTSTLVELLDALDALRGGKPHKYLLMAAGKASRSAGSMLSSEDTRELVAIVARSGDQWRLARLWLEGLLPNWQSVPLSGARRRLSLPTYPFADRRHWIATGARAPAVPQVDGGVPALHPLIDSNESTFERQVYRKTFSYGDFVIADHLVSRIATLPGVAYLDLARAAGELATGRAVRSIHNIVWLSPLTVAEGGSTDAWIELKPQGVQIGFEVFAERDAGTRQIYAQGKLSFAVADAAESATTVAGPETLDLDAIKRRCDRVMKGADAYPLFDSLGLSLGQSFQVLDEVHCNASEVLGRLRLDPQRLDTAAAFVLHPALCDGAFQALMAAMLSGASGEMIVPYSLGEVEILDRLTPVCYSYVTDAATTGTRLSKKNAVITDEHGRILVRVRDSVGVALTDVHEKKMIAPSTEPEPVAVPALQSLFYAPTWRSAPAATGGALGAQQVAVLFCDSPQVAAALRQQLARRGVGAVVTVARGNDYACLEQWAYALDPARPEGFGQLLDDVLAAGLSPSHIFYAWPMRTAHALTTQVTESWAAAALAESIYPFFHLCQALLTRQPEAGMHLVYAHAAADSHTQPQHEAVAAFVRILAAEHPKIRYKTLALLGASAAGAAALEEVLADELSAAAGWNVNVRYQVGERTLAAVECINLAAEAGAPTVSHLPVRERGVYLITGGAGGLGLNFAKYLAQGYHARLVLTGRSTPSPAMECALGELVELGGEAIYVPGDIANGDDVRRIVGAAKARFGALHGVLHSAGVLRDAYVRKTSAADLAAVLAPKVQGTLLLDRETATEQLDWFVAFSSLAALSTNAGQGGYAFANHFMDHFMMARESWCRAGLRTGKSLSINWSLWADGGMRLDAPTLRFFRRNLGIEPFTVESGLRAFWASLAGPYANLVAIDGVRDKIEQSWDLVKGTDAAAIGSTPAAVPEQAAPLAAQDELDSAVAGVLSEIVMRLLELAASDIDCDTILLDLGFDSIGLATFANACNEKYGLDMTPVLFFEYPTIRDIARYVVTEHRQSALAVHADQRGLAAVANGADVPTQIAPVEPSQPAATAAKAWRPPAAETAERQAFSATERFVHQPIAIVGACGVMPQADDLEEYWTSLRDAQNNMVTLVPEDRWNWRAYYGDPLEQENKTLSKWGGFMREVDKFDPLFWGISPREAEMMDPQQRIFLETVWGAIEDSGHRVSEFAGSKTGVFVGASTRDYIDLMAAEEAELDGYSASGTSHAVLANRVSFLLDLRGPSAPLDTACSSSLVALHRAIESIHTGSCEMAIVGGVQVMLSAAGHISFGAAGMLASDGRCKTFDAAADGYVRGEGSGAILIKPLAKALADGDHVYAVVRGTAENHGGRATMLTAPNPQAQAEVLIEAWDRAQVDPATAGYIECHGTGTSLGDPIEIQSMKKAFQHLYARHGKTSAPSPHIALTSVKTNIGHLETAAGIAGILKVLMSIKHQQVPALLHFDRANPYIKLDGTPFYLATCTHAWQRITTADGVTHPRRAGISSFGFGGANVHVVLEEYVPAPRAEQQYHGPYLFVLSAKSAERLQAYAERMLAWLVTPRDLAPLDLAYTLQVGRDAMSERLAFEFVDLPDLTAKLERYLDAAQPPAGVHRGCVPRKRDSLSLSGLEPELQRGIVDVWFQERKWSRLLEGWVNGIEIDWSRLYVGVVPCRIALPTYPFARRRCWFNTRAVNQPIDGWRAKYPMLEANTSMPGVYKYSSTVRIGEGGTIPVGGDSQLLPLIGLEMARAVFELSIPDWSDDWVSDIGDVRWNGASLVEPGAVISACLFEYSDDGACSFDVMREAKAAASGEAVLLGSGSVRRRRRGAPRKIGDVDVAFGGNDLVVPEELVEAEWDDAELLEGLAGLRPSQVRFNARQVIATVSLAESAGQSDHVLAALAFEYALRLFKRVTALTSGTYWPALQVCAIGSLTAYGPVGETCVLVVDSDSGAGGRRCSLTIANGAGEVCLEARGVELSAPYPSAQANELLMCRQRLKPMLAAPTLEPDVDLAVVFSADAQCGEILPPALPGAVFDCVRYSPAAAPHQLYAEIADKILSALQQYCTGRKPRHRRVCFVVHAREAGAQFLGLAGLLRSAEHELGGVALGLLVSEAATAAALAEDLATAGGVSGAIARLGDSRQWSAPTLEQIDLSRSLPYCPYRDRGTYVITGGLGGLGRIFCRDILNSASGAHVYLTGRMPLTDTLQRSLAAEFPAADRLHYRQMDPSDAEATARTIAAIQRERPITGLLHIAGASEDGPITAKTTAAVAEVLAPKVAGTANLDAATRGLDLDFFALFSSIVAITGNPGQTDYAAANGYLNWFSDWRQQQVWAGRRRGASIALAWPYWSDGGMRISATVEEVVRAHSGMVPLPSAVGLLAFRHALAAAGASMLVTYGNSHALREFAAIELGAELAPSPSVGGVAGVASRAPAPSAITTLRHLVARDLARFMADSTS